LRDRGRRRLVARGRLTRGPDWETAMAFTAVPDNPVPEGAEEIELVAADGVRLRAGRFPPTGSAARGTICLFQGRAEYIEKYFETIRDLTARGYTVAALDWRGQGASERQTPNPRKGHVASFDHFERDLAVFLEKVVRPACPEPHVAIAHSMGGLAIFRNERHGTRPFARIVLSAPLFGLGPIYEPVGLARVVSALVANLGFEKAFVPTASSTPVDWNPFVDNKVTSDPARFARAAAIVEANPALALGGPTVGWVHAAFCAMADLEREHFVERIGTPVLIVAAGKDQIVSNHAIERIGARLRVGRVITVPNAEHEMMNERDVYREPFLAAADAFLAEV